MSRRFRHHYSRDEARQLLPQVRQWLKQIQEINQGLQVVDQRLGQLLASGVDAGGDLANAGVRHIGRLKVVLREFSQREIQIKDIERGLIDFPAMIGDKEVFLCWEQDEEDIEYWHDLDSGYPGRERI